MGKKWNKVKKFVEENKGLIVFSTVVIGVTVYANVRAAKDYKNHKNAYEKVNIEKSEWKSGRSVEAVHSLNVNEKNGYVVCANGVSREQLGGLGDEIVEKIPQTEGYKFNVILATDLSEEGKK